MVLPHDQGARWPIVGKRPRYLDHEAIVGPRIAQLDFAIMRQRYSGVQILGP